MLRRHRRFSIDLEAAGGTLWVRDISAGGMRVLSDTALCVNQVVECALDTERGAIRVRGRVVRARRSGRQVFAVEYGVEFEPLTGTNRALLLQLLDELEEQGARQPESPLDPLDVERLRERIAELEDQNGVWPGADSGPSSAPLAAELPAHLSAGGSEEERLATSFTRARFAHLLQLGQPLLTLATSPGEDLVSAAERAIAAAFSSRFDLDDVRAATGGSLSEEQLVDALFTCYERNLIDFA